MLALRKSNKNDYIIPKTYKSIALLNIMRKILELVIAKRLTRLAEINNLLPPTQMGARAGRSAETALQLITEQVHAIWGLPGPQKVATLLSMDISGAFDHVSHERLIHNLRKKRIPTIITDWVRSFLHNRATTIKLLEGESQQFTIATGIPQGSPISPILFLFFISDLLDITNNEALRLSSTGFVDDINILTYGETTERNCRVLERIHRKCEEWAVTHGARFAPEKYELLHLTRAPKRFNLKAVPTLGGVQVETKPSIRVLGIQIDSKLKWGPHIKKIHDRFASQSLALSRITTSTWGAGFEKAKLIYNSVIKPTILYDAGVWYSPQGTVTARKGVDKALETLQNQCIRTVLGAYKATSGPILEKEAEISPITTTLDKAVANAVRRQATTQGGKTVTNIRDKLRRNAIPGWRRKLRQNRPTPGEIKANWLRERVSEKLWTELTS